MLNYVLVPPQKNDKILQYITYNIEEHIEDFSEVHDATDSLSLSTMRGNRK